jgi:hypothetical protein
VGRGDGDARSLLFRSLVDLDEGDEGTAALQARDLRDRCGQGRLAVVNMTNGTDIDVRLLSLKFLLGHDSSPFSFLGQFFGKTRGHAIVVIEQHGVCRAAWVLERRSVA